MPGDNKWQSDKNTLPDLIINSDASWLGRGACSGSIRIRGQVELGTKQNNPGTSTG